MTRDRKTLALTAVAGVIAAGALLGTTALHAQKPQTVHPTSSDRGMMSWMVEGPNQTWLGVELKDVTSDQVRDLKLGGEYGAFVDKVEDDSPAAKAGLQAGDVIVEFAGERARSVAELRRLVDETPAGRNVEIKVKRGGEEKTLNATVEVRNENMEPLMGKLRDQVWPRINVPVYDFSFNFGGPRLGVEVDPLTKQLGDYFGVKDGKGVLVREVSPGSAAEKAGVKAGDCITKIDSAPIESANELHRALLRKQGESREGRDITLTIVRDRNEQTLKVHLEPARQPGRDASESGMADLVNSQELAQEAQNLASSKAMADALRNYESSVRADAGDIQKQADQLRKEWLDQSGEWRQQLKDLHPQIREYQRQIKELQGSLYSDEI